MGKFPDSLDAEKCHQVEGLCDVRMHRGGSIVRQAMGPSKPMCVLAGRDGSPQHCPAQRHLSARCFPTTSTTGTEPAQGKRENKREVAGNRARWAIVTGRNRRMGRAARAEEKGMTKPGGDNQELQQLIHSGKLRSLDLTALKLHDITLLYIV